MQLDECTCHTFRAVAVEPSRRVANQKSAVCPVLFHRVKGIAAVVKPFGQHLLVAIGVILCQLAVNPSGGLVSPLFHHLAGVEILVFPVKVILVYGNLIEDIFPRTAGFGNILRRCRERQNVLGGKAMSST